MTTQRQLLTALIVIAVLTCATGQNPELTALPVGSATIAELTGEVTLNSGQGEAMSAAPGMVLAPETKNDTGKGSMLLDLQDGSEILVKSNSHVVLKAPSQEKGYWLELLLGKINA